MSLMNTLIERFAKDAPVAVMVRVAFANIVSPAALDAIFKSTAKVQYTGELLFSTVVELLGLVVMKQQSALNSAYRHRQESMQVSVTALYQKLRRVEFEVIRELVRGTSEKMTAVLAALGKLRAPLIAGYDCRVLDGFHLAGTERRIRETRNLRATPLPGQYLVVFDPQLNLIRDLYPCPDGHAQERSILPELVEDLKPGTLWIMDRNFCTKMWLMEIAINKSFFVVRHHAGLPLQMVGTRRRVGRTDSATVYEQQAIVHDDFGGQLTVRCVTVQLDQRTADGERTIVLLTNLPPSVAGTVVAEAYRQRWTIERGFLDLTMSWNGEIDTLAYPPAALLATAIAFLAYNIMSVVKAAIAATHGEDQHDELSTYYLAGEVASVTTGMQIVIPSGEWQKRYEKLNAKELAQTLQSIARGVDLTRYRKNRRGPKKQQPKRTGPRGHVSTARLLATRQHPP